MHESLTSFVIILYILIVTYTDDGIFSLLCNKSSVSKAVENCVHRRDISALALKELRNKYVVRYS